MHQVFFGLVQTFSSGTNSAMLLVEMLDFENTKAVVHAVGVTAYFGVDVSIDSSFASGLFPVLTWALSLSLLNHISCSLTSNANDIKK